MNGEQGIPGFRANTGEGYGSGDLDAAVPLRYPYSVVTETVRKELKAEGLET